MHRPSNAARLRHGLLTAETAEAAEKNLGYPRRFLRALRENVACLHRLFGRSSPWWHVKQVTLPSRDSPSAGLWSGKNRWLMAFVISSMLRAVTLRGFASLAKLPRAWQEPHETPSDWVINCISTSNS